MYKLCVLVISLLRAYGALLYANVGDNVTLPCFYDPGAKHLCWYKQVAGQQPQIISSIYVHQQNFNNFYNQFKDNTRFSVHTGDRFYHLNISKVQDSDSAMYYCGQTSIAVTEFDKGTFLVLKESSCRSFLQQRASDSVQSGGSVTLNCTVHTGISDSEHTVYWFKKDTVNSTLGIMYIHTHSSSECVMSSEFGSPAQSCVYSFSKNQVSPSDSGMYYCAVASCGNVLFGKGTRLDVEGEHAYDSTVLRHSLVAALLLSGIMNIILFCILCNMNRRKKLPSAGLNPQQSVPETAERQFEECDGLQYVTLDFKKKQSKAKRLRSKVEEPVYTGVIYQT